MFDIWAGAAALAIICLALWSYGYMRNAGIRQFMNRGDFQSAWQEHNLETQEVERILHMLCTAYMFPVYGRSKKKINPIWCFSPNDTLSTIHQTCTQSPQAPTPDDIAIKMFTLQLSDHYGYDEEVSEGKQGCEEIHQQTLATLIADILS